MVHYGIDAAAFDAPRDSESLKRGLGIPLEFLGIGTVGRLSEVKSQDLLIRGCAAIAEQDPKPHLVLVGDGPELHGLRQLAVDLGLSDRVHFSGYPYGNDATGITNAAVF